MAKSVVTTVAASAIAAAVVEAVPPVEAEQEAPGYVFEPMSARDLNRAIAAIIKATHKIGPELHNVLFNSVAHIMTARDPNNPDAGYCGNITPLNKLVFGVHDSVHRKGMMIWLGQFFPAIGAKDGTLVLRKDWMNKKWDFEQAFASPFYTLAAAKSDNDAKPFSMLDGYEQIARIGKIIRGEVDSKAFTDDANVASRALQAALDAYAETAGIKDKVDLLKRAA